jgi:hypothetical protein
MKSFFANLPYGNDKNTLTKWQIICIGLGCYVFFAFLMNVCTKLYTIFGFDIRTLLHTKSNIQSNWGILWGTLFILLIAPIIEETSWRLCLSFKKNHIAISLAAICMYVPRIFLKMPLISASSFSLVIIGIFVYFMIIRYTTTDFWEKIKGKYVKYIVWSLILAFTLLHLYNYCPLGWQYFVAYILILARSLFFAITTTYLRLNLGFVYCVLYHIACNSDIILRI